MFQPKEKRSFGEKCQNYSLKMFKTILFYLKYQFQVIVKKERQRRKVGEAAPELMQEGAKVKTFLIKLEQIYFMSLYAQL